MSRHLGHTLGKISKRCLAAALLLVFVFWLMDRIWPLPMAEFERRHFAQVVVDRSGQPLRAFADADGIWRYPVSVAEVSPRYIEALVNYEDRHFYRHFGVNPLAVIRALWQRIQSDRFVSGASTLTMQVARILKPHEKTVAGKLTQMFRAMQLEWHYSKEEILTFYLNYAPFGGTIEGVQAASYAYLGKPASELSHSEAALLAVLPQAPSRYRPDRYPQRAQQARDKVLNRLLEQGVWSPQQVAEAQQEAVWATYNTRPMKAPLLAQRLRQQHPDQALIQATVDLRLQTALEWMLKDHIKLHADQVSAAILVVDNQDLSVLAYLGSAEYLNNERQGFVDMVQARRSPGSTLKPFIYGMALDQGLIHSQSLLFDVPHSFAGYRPRNFTDEFSGPVSVTQALTRSLNMPAVQVLDQLSPEAFYVGMKNAGLDIHMPSQAQPNLSLALGGGSVSMEQLTGVFAALGRQGQAGPLRFSAHDPTSQFPLLSEGAAWIIQQVLSQAPLNHHLQQRHLLQKPGIAFKTGTSFGNRDAWVLASNQRITVGVWVGQPDGSYLENNTGRNAAVPLLNQVLAMVPDAWHVPIEQPFTVEQATICWPLGYRASQQDSAACHMKKTAYLLDGVAPPTLSDPMSQVFATETHPVMIDALTGRQVTPQCAPAQTTTQSVTLWPLVLEPWLPKHLKREQLLPPFSPECRLLASANKLEILGIHDQAVLYPEVSSMAISAVHLQVAGSQGLNHWFLNGQLLPQQSTEVILQGLKPGFYRLQVIDSSAQQASISFSVQG
ncbi:penicillin-binding protein 1C [Marinicella meishanensis]|uniref:penicillin-binding protein 1C n=1 Tax=Marinicella meishanensis TaxID=2873263 RepID=UPI001CC0A691|nr:penicillin-binding protein 1C [Marinicella sp. NBU2979]